MESDPDVDSVPDPDPDPVIFVSDLQGVNKKFFALYFLKVHLRHFPKIKSRDQSFSYYFA